jgi:hypothetical protein
MSDVFIYGLEDPITKEIRYIGKTINTKNRYYQHVCNFDNTNPHKKNWISLLKKQGLKPNLVIIEKTNEKNWEKRERYWIKTGLELGWKLTNISAGGSVHCEHIATGKEWDEAIKYYIDKNELQVFSDLPEETKINICQKVAIKLMDYSYLRIKERGNDPKKEYNKDVQFWAGCDLARTLINQAIKV